MQPLTHGTEECLYRTLYTESWNPVKLLPTCTMQFPVWTRSLVYMRSSSGKLYTSLYASLPGRQVRFAHQRECHQQPTAGQDQKWKVMFFGTDHFSLPHLQALEKARQTGHLIDRLEVTVPGSKLIKRRGKRKQTSPVWDFSQDEGLPCHHWPVGGDVVSGFDVGVIVSFGHLIPQWLIQSFPMGILNVHPSLLPRWRGGAPIQHTILSGDEVTGVSIMRIHPQRFDVGPILLQRECQVSAESTVESLSPQLAKIGSEMLLEVFTDLTRFIESESPQTEEGVTFGRKIPVDMAWVDWRTSVQHVDRLFRAIGGQMPLKTLFGNEEVKLEQMVSPHELHDVEMNHDGAPGQIVFDKIRNIICVRCQDGWVGFQAISPINRKKMTAKEFYNGYLSASKKESEGKQRHFTSHRTINR